MPKQTPLANSDFVAMGDTVYKDPLSYVNIFVIHYIHFRLFPLLSCKQVACFRAASLLFLSFYCVCEYQAGLCKCALSIREHRISVREHAQTNSGAFVTMTYTVSKLKKTMLQ